MDSPEVTTSAMDTPKLLIGFLVIVLILHPCTSDLRSQCEAIKDCILSSEMLRLTFYTTRRNSLGGQCYNDKSVLPRGLAVRDNIDVRNFKANSTWIGVFLSEIHGIALSPLFLPYGNLGCADYVIRRVTPDRIALEYKLFSSETVDFRFAFNGSGWIQYEKRYGCPKDSFQIDRIRIIDTDYQDYLLLYGCESTEYMGGFKIPGYLLLVQKTILEEKWTDLQNLMSAFGDFDDNQNYTLPDRSTYLKDRTLNCPSKVTNKNPLCPKELLANSKVELENNMVELVKELGTANRPKKIIRPGEATAYDSVKRDDLKIPIPEVSCYITMFISVGLALYFTHFSL